MIGAGRGAGRGLGYGLWLGRKPLEAEAAERWGPYFAAAEIETGSPVLDSARDEVARSVSRLFPDGAGPAGSGAAAGNASSPAGDGTPETASPATGGLSAPRGFVAGRPGFVRSRLGLDLSEELPPSEGFLIRVVSGAGGAGNGGSTVVVAARTDKGVLYGVFALFRLVETSASPESLDLAETPAVSFRMLDHWDNLDGSIERGYAGRSLWNWAELPSRVHPRYSDYARACASVGINAASLNNVNASAEILSPAYLEKAAAIAGALRPWGVRAFLSVNFASPMRLGGLPTSDPLDPAVAAWWAAKAAEIHALIPDFGGFLVKADSEGQPGPFAYGRTHADGANMLGRALAPFGGIVIWRAFVYGHGEADRAKKAWANFMPHDGDFEPNVAIQVKNGAIDFQPREPVHPLFGSMEKTPLFMEFQVTQEYLGQGNHVVYLGPMWKEILSFDTHARGPGSTVARLLSGGGFAESLDRAGVEPPPGPAPLSGIAAVSNIGDDDDWCGSLFHPLNWYALGRLAWDPSLDTDVVAREWIAMTWGRDRALVDGILGIVSPSWEACVDYMTPLCLHHIMREGHHYGPDPAYDAGEREDWRSTYYHRADATGLGFDRTRRGSAAVDQYRKPVADLFDDIGRCPEKYLLWFHHVPWERRLASGRTLAEELPFRYARGVAAAKAMRERWLALAPKVGAAAHAAVLAKLDIQVADAEEWESTCVPYFLAFAKSGRPAH